MPQFMTPISGGPVPHAVPESSGLVMMAAAIIVFGLKVAWDLLRRAGPGDRNLLMKRNFSGPATLKQGPV
jgi:hypothetical protein